MIHNQKCQALCVCGRYRLIVNRIPMAMPVYTCIKCTACSHLNYHSQRRALLSLQSGITWNYRLSSSILCHDLELPTEDRGSFRTARIEDPYSTRPSCIWILQRRGLCNLAHQGRFVPCTM